MIRGDYTQDNAKPELIDFGSADAFQIEGESDVSSITFLMGNFAEQGKEKEGATMAAAIEVQKAASTWKSGFDGLKRRFAQNPEALIDEARIALSPQDIDRIRACITEFIMNGSLMKEQALQQIQSMKENLKKAKRIGRSKKMEFVVDPGKMSVYNRLKELESYIQSN
jgi:hypothetical protein